MKNLLLILFCSVAFSFAHKHKIISLTPSITETLYILGETENVVGITSFCRQISPRQKIVGTYLEPNIEEIIKLSPTIVFISKEGVKKEIVQQLRNFKINVIVLEPVNNYIEIKQQLLTIAKYLNKEIIAKKIIEEYESKFKIHRDDIESKKQKKLVGIISLKPLIVSSTSSYIGDIIKISGAFNPISSDVRYPQISVEELLRIDPEIIILPEMGMKKKEIESFFARFKNLSAVKDNKIYIIPSEILCQPNIKNFFLSVERIREILKEK